MEYIPNARRFEDKAYNMKWVILERAMIEQTCPFDRNRRFIRTQETGLEILKKNGVDKEKIQKYTKWVEFIFERMQNETGFR